MSGEYVRWLARDVKPREKKELTPEEKAKLFAVLQNMGLVK